MSSPNQTFSGPRIASVAFVTLLAAFGLNFAAGQFFAPLSEAQGWTLGTTSAIAALNTAVSGLAQPFLGQLIDRRGPRLVISLSLSAMGTAYVLMAAAGEVWQFALAYGVLAGVGFAGSSSLAVTVLLSRWFVARRAEILPKVFLGINAGQLTLVPLGGLLIDQAGYRTAYLLLGLVVLVAVVPVVALGMVDRPEHVGQHPDGAAGPPRPVPVGSTLLAALSSREFWLATLAFGVNGFTLYFTLLHLPRLARDLGGSLAVGGVLIAAAAAASALGMLATVPLSRRFGKRRVVIAFFGVRAAALAGTAALASSTAHLAFFAVAFGLSSFPVIPMVMGLIGERFGTNVLGGVLGLVFVSHQAFAGLGVLCGGALRSATGSYDAPLWVAAASLLVGIALLARVPDRDLPTQTHSDHPDAGEAGRPDLVPPFDRNPQPIL